MVHGEFYLLGYNAVSEEHDAFMCRVEVERESTAKKVANRAVLSRRHIPEYTTLHNHRYEYINPTGWFITVFTKARHLPSILIQINPVHPVLN
jgi:hypothetical protein